MIAHMLRSIPPLRRTAYHLCTWRSKTLLDTVCDLVPSDDHILDIGSGMCVITEALQQQGRRVTPLDVADLSFTPAIRPILYDGMSMPFDDDSFDTALLITVLHHTPHPEAVIQEAARVARKILIVEDIYSTTAGKYFTFAADSLLNLEFTGHPRTNKRDDEWRALFESLGLHLTDARYNRALGLFTHGTYFVSR